MALELRPSRCFQGDQQRSHGGRPKNKNAGSEWYPLKANSSRVNANNSNKLKFANRLCEQARFDLGFGTGIAHRYAWAHKF
jgi:hypothetical protein